MSCAPTLDVPDVVVTEAPLIVHRAELPVVGAVVTVNVKCCASV